MELANDVPAKRRFVNEILDDKSISMYKPYENFQVKKIINENSRCKTLCVYGHFEQSNSDAQNVAVQDSAVIILEKLPFSENEVKQILREAAARTVLENDIYSTFELKRECCEFDIKATMIHPATEQHVIKYTKQAVYLIEESADDYKSITLPYIEEVSLSLKWVYNILEHKTEVERIVYENADPEAGFILLPDMKWTNGNVSELYLVAIVHKHGLRSIRDLRQEHLPLLRNILNLGREAINQRYGVGPDKLRIYVHYQPSYYHFHVHFTHIDYEAPGCGVEKAHLLLDVIENIEMDTNYYERKTLSFVIRDLDKLCLKYKDAGKIVTKAATEAQL